MNVTIVAFVFALLLANASSAFKPAPKPACPQDSLWLMNLLNDWFPEVNYGHRWATQTNCAGSNCILLQETNPCKLPCGVPCRTLTRLNSVLICDRDLEWFCRHHKKHPRKSERDFALRAIGSATKDESSNLAKCEAEIAANYHSRPDIL